MLMDHTCDGIVFQILRVYAIGSRRWQLAVLVGVLNVWPFAFPIVGLLLLVYVIKAVHV